jgi:hypothetical protein
MKKLALIRILMLTILCALLLAGALAYAQETPTGEAAAEVPTGGVTTLVLLMGLGAVTLVGAGMIARNNFKQDSN